MHTQPLRITITRAALCAMLLAQSGCFTAISHWGGAEPEPATAATAAVADIVTSPIQIPILTAAAIHHAATKPTKEEIEAAKKRSLEETAKREQTLAHAQHLFDRLKERPELLDDNAFWNENAADPVASHYALVWFLQEPNAPHSSQMNARLLARFPDDAQAILSPERTTHAELTALVSDTTVPYETREAAIDTLVRDDSFDFGEPWRTILRRDFPNKVLLLFGTRRYTRIELIAIRDDPAQSPNMRRGAELNLGYGNYKSAP